MNKLLLVASNELLKHLRRYSFIIVTLLFPVLGVLAIVASSVMHQIEHMQSRSDEEQATEGERPGTIPDMGKAMPGADDEDDEGDEPGIGYVDRAGVIRRTDVVTTPHFIAYPDEEAARMALAHEEIEAYYLLPTHYLTSGAVARFSTRRQFEAADVPPFARLLRFNLLEDTDPQVIARLGSVLSLETVRLDKTGEPEEGRYAQYDMEESDSPLVAVPFGFAVLLYLSIFSSAGLLMHSVVEEKENRILEILLTSMRAWQLLGGKIVGLGLLGLVQLVVWILTAVFLLEYYAASPGESLQFLSEVDLPPYVWLLTLPYFVLGYLVYGGLMAGIGATVSTTRESSILTSLLAIPVMLPFFLLFVILDNPDGIVATILSIIPYTASITMMTRLTLTDVVWWQIVLSLVLLSGSVVLSIWLGAKIFRATMLMKGKKLSLKEIVWAVRAGG